MKELALPVVTSGSPGNEPTGSRYRALRAGLSPDGRQRLRPGAAVPIAARPDLGQDRGVLHRVLRISPREGGTPSTHPNLRKLVFTLQVDRPKLLRLQGRASGRSRRELRADSDVEIQTPT